MSSTSSSSESHVKLNRSGTRVHHNCSQTTAFHVTHMPTLLRSFWRKFLEKGVASCVKHVLVQSAKQDIPRFKQFCLNKVCVGRRWKTRRRVSQRFLMVTTSNQLTWSPSVDRKAVDYNIHRNLILPKILSKTTIRQCSTQTSTNCIYPAGRTKRKSRLVPFYEFGSIWTLNW